MRNVIGNLLRIGKMATLQVAPKVNTIQRIKIPTTVPRLRFIMVVIAMPIKTKTRNMVVGVTLTTFNGLRQIPGAAPALIVRSRLQDNRHKALPLHRRQVIQTLPVLMRPAVPSDQ